MESITFYSILYLLERYVAYTIDCYYAKNTIKYSLYFEYLQCAGVNAVERSYNISPQKAVYCIERVLIDIVVKKAHVQ